jgi:hypothetical protein
LTVIDQNLSRNPPIRKILTVIDQNPSRNSNILTGIDINSGGDPA